MPDSEAPTPGPAQIPVFEPVAEPVQPLDLASEVVPEAALEQAAEPSIVSAEVPSQVSEPVSEDTLEVQNDSKHSTVERAIVHAQSPLSQSSQADVSRTLLIRARDHMHKIKEAKLEKILHFIVTKGEVGNNDVQALIKCSDATATRYLKILVVRGLVASRGAGSGVVYVRV